ncbi:pyruvate carboxylase [Egibacter rhizosphaerae]|uniref:Pyruvate carboxylase n=1 Tax=Egibacter rhizosphaerae TaxID=1670831 RepID=A0A411YDH0_9ACTN|nr:pyruvate carboxylase [Egibacter rhizosphaerae]QBI19274.1 pyruvate carboxylase [Egibacter rhizosphaerae]
MVEKVLVANRGEIAIRAFRAATELGMRTVAVYTLEDRDSLHRLKADEAYQIGEPGHPVRAYLDGDELIATAREVGADAIYPGYGFLSESTDFAAACARAGITFVGPPAEVLGLTGDKVRARGAAADAGIPVLRASSLMEDPSDAPAAAEELGFPVFVKAAAGGGGRGLRRVERPEDLPRAVETAIREAEGAFGDPTVFLEQAVTRPRHIEVQILAGSAGEVLHLYERDCSVQRRHQKVVELAPAPDLDPEVREQICADAVRFGRAVDYRNAGTVEFLLDPDTGRHVFIECNPRIQVEHTVTEEVTDIDLVQSQLRIADGATLKDLGLRQDDVRVRGTAIQCRITTEDPRNDFRPDTGRISAYRSPGGAGIRLDAGSAFVGSVVSPHFDSMLVKLTARGLDLSQAARRARRALAEFRIRGVRTNTPFLQAVLADPDFLAGRVSTSFIDERPHLTRVSAGENRAQRMLEFVADRTVNRPHGEPGDLIDPGSKVPNLRGSEDPPAGSRQRLEELGPDAFAAELRAQEPIALTDTTLRDAHQSLFATRMRTFDMVAAAPHLARRLPQLLSLEAWGGATYDVALRFLYEDPWSRLSRLREAVPNICLQMLLRGRNLLGYTGYPDEVVHAFVAEATDAGIDIFRVFDALNDLEQMRTAITAVREAGALAEGALCYTSDLHDPGEHTYTLDHYLRVAEGLVEAGAHILCIKDMAGLLRPPAARTLVTALRERFEQPVHLHTHDTAGGQLGTYVAALEAGVDALDGAQAPLSGMTSQPNLAAIVAATDRTERASGVSLDALGDLEPYWHAVRQLYRPFEAGLAYPTGTVYRHEIPGGQLSNLRAQANAVGLAGRFEEVEEAYAACNDVLGNIIKVTPTSKVVGDLALQCVSTGLDPYELAADPSGHDLPDSVIGFLRGELGTPPGGWPEPFRTKVLAARGEAPVRTTLADADRAGLETPGAERRAKLNHLLFPGPAQQYEEARERWGDLSVLPTEPFLYGLDQDREIAIDLERGVRLYVELEAVSEPDERGFRTVHVTLNGQSRPIDVRDESVESEIARVEKADPNQPGHVAAPLTGVVTPSVAEGDRVQAGSAVATIEAMKMESQISAPASGTVNRVVVVPATAVEPGDLVLELDLDG